MTRTEDRVVLSDLTGDGSRVLLVPLSLARAELTTYSVLAGAGTFEGLAQDAEAARIVLGWLDSYVERITAYGEEVAPGYDPETVFGEDNWRVWRAEPRRTTAEWLSEAHPDLFHRYARPDDSWGFDCDEHPFIPAADRAAVERALEQLGYEVRHRPDLELVYLNADVEALP